MKHFILALCLALTIGLTATANACTLQTIIVNGQMQTWQVCCFPGGQCQYTRVG